MEKATINSRKKKDVFYLLFRENFSKVMLNKVLLSIEKKYLK